MVWFDYILIGIISISGLVSLLRGFFKEAVSLSTWVAAFFISSQFYLHLSPYITAASDPLIRQGIAILALFVATMIVGGLVNHIIGKLIDSTGLSGTDRVLGLVFGGLRGVLIVCALLFFMDAFTRFPDAAWWQQSIVVPELKLIIRWFFEYFESSSSLLNNV